MPPKTAGGLDSRFLRTCFVFVLLLSLGIHILAGSSVLSAQSKWDKPALDWEMPFMAHEFDHAIQVTAESHASGEHTLQDALDEVPEEGAVIELGEGEFYIDNVSTPENRPLKITGKGSDTLLKAEGHFALTLGATAYIELSDIRFEGEGHHYGVQIDGAAYENMIFRDLQFSNYGRSALHGAAANGPITGLLVTGCEFTDAGAGANFRIGGDSRYLEISNNIFIDIETRPVTVGNGDTRYARITGNHIEGVGPGRHPIGILSYTPNTLIENNTIKDLYNEDGSRQEAISSRGSNTIIRNNEMVNAGGRTAAISLAGAGPTTIEGNVIRFTEEHRSNERDGMDLRQAKVHAEGNTLMGTRRGITSRRGIKDMVIKKNIIRESKYQSSAVRICISTGAEIPKAHMSGLTISGNKVASITREEDPGEFTGILFRPINHAGDHDTRMEEIVIANNTFIDIKVAEGSRGVGFTGLDRATSHMKNVKIERNNFGDMDERVCALKQLVENLSISD